MQALAQQPWRRIAKPLACALALLSLLFLLQVTPHSHANGQDEAACRLCQAAHVSATPAISGITLYIPLAPSGEVTAAAYISATQSFFRHSPSRAPPFEVEL